MDARWLQTQFDLNPDQSKSGLAKALDLEPSAVSKILNGNRQIKAHEYVVMRSYFGLPNDGARTLIAKSNNENSELNALHEKEQEISNSAWLIPGQNSKPFEDSFKIYKVRENSLAPDFKPGDHITIDLNDTTPSPAGTFLISDGYGTLLRHCEFVPNSSPPEITLKTKDSKENQQISKIKIIGRVSGKIDWL